MKFSDWEMKKYLIKWIFEGACPLCGCILEPLEVHHGRRRGKPGDHGSERLGEIIPLCWFCHPIVEFLRSPQADDFKARVRRMLKRAPRLRLSLEQIGKWAEADVRLLSAKLNEVEWGLDFLQAMQDRWEEEHGDDSRRAA
jgi:hypothetical protein